jgi:hypothetical protein
MEAGDNKNGPKRRIFWAIGTSFFFSRNFLFTSPIYGIRSFEPRFVGVLLTVP